MSDTISSGPAAAASSEDRIVATAVYVLLFLAPFFAGVTAFIGVVLAYARRPLADAASRSHYAFQIRTFWIAAIVLVVALAVAVAGVVVMVAHGFDAHARGGIGFDAWDVSFGEDDAHLNLAGLILLVAGGLLFARDLLWLMLASVFGAARLLSGEPIGRLKGA